MENAFNCISYPEYNASTFKYYSHEGLLAFIPLPTTPTTGGRFSVYVFF
jgi:hypothetical protein